MADALRAPAPVPRKRLPHALDVAGQLQRKTKQHHRPAVGLANEALTCGATRRPSQGRSVRGAAEPTGSTVPGGRWPTAGRFRNAGTSTCQGAASCKDGAKASERGQRVVDGPGRPHRRQRLPDCAKRRGRRSIRAFANLRPRRPPVLAYTKAIEGRPSIRSQFVRVGRGLVGFNRSTLTRIPWEVRCDQRYR